MIASNVEKYFELVSIRRVRVGVLVNIVLLSILSGLVVADVVFSGVSAIALVSLSGMVLSVSVVLFGLVLFEVGMKHFLHLSTNVFFVHVFVAYSGLIIGLSSGLILGGALGVSLVAVGCGLFVTVPLWYVYHGWQLSLSKRYQSAEEFSVSPSDVVYDKALNEDDALSPEDIDEKYN